MLWACGCTKSVDGTGLYAGRGRNGRPVTSTLFEQQTAGARAGADWLQGRTAGAQPTVITSSIGVFTCLLIQRPVGPLEKLLPVI